MNKSTLIILILLICQTSALLSIECEKAVSYFSDYTCIQSQAIGEGANAKAFLVRNKAEGAEDRILKVQEVIKPIRLLFAEKERDLLYSFKHPNIIRIYEDKIEDNYMFEILEYGSGGSLETSVSQNKEYFKDRINVLRAFRQLLQGVNYIHNSNKVHADLKPANVVLDSDKNLKIIDFDSAATCNQFNKIRGTPLYMEPNLFFSEDIYIEFDQFMDIYGLGIILYQMTHENQLPFYKETMQEFVDSLEEGSYTIRGGLDGEIAFMIHSCLRFDKKDRMSLVELFRYTDVALDNQAPEYLIPETNLVSNKLDWQIKFENLESNHFMKNELPFKKDVFLKNGLLVESPVYETIKRKFSIM